MQELQPSFKTATNCEAFNLTTDLLEQILNKAKREGREYAWTPLDDDYWLPEKDNFDYEIQCPNFDVFLVQENPVTVDVFTVLELGKDSQNYICPFAKVFQVSGEPNIPEIVDLARIYSYLRFYVRDHYRDCDQKWWSHFILENPVSFDTVPIFYEDKIAAQSWASKTFPNNAHNAWIGKCGEFVFATWAGECGLTVSSVDLKDHPNGDEQDFAHKTLFITDNGNHVKIDVKAFQVESGNQRNWWNVSESCLDGKHRQDFIVFVIVDENFRMGKVVGFLSSDEVLKKGKYQQSYTEYGSYSRGYYRVSIDAIHNPYFLRATLDSKNQVFNGLFFGVKAHDVITEMIKDYPLDPIAAYYADCDWRDFRRGGVTNLMAKPSLKMFVPIPNYFE